MINDSELFEIGQTIKPHGICGEISATIDADLDLSLLRCIVFDIDGIYVPFFIKSSRVRGSEAVLLSIDGIDNEHQAAELCPLTIYALRTDLDFDINGHDSDGFYISDLIGFKLFDSEDNFIGTISDFDDSTQNLLLIVENPAGKTVYVPLADDLVEKIEQDDKKLSINIANGLLDL